MKSRLLDNNVRQYVLKLYINASKDTSIADELRLWLNRELGDTYKLIVVDLSNSLASGETGSIFAAPTLIKLFPPPPVRVIGDLLDSERVLEQIRVSTHIRG